MKEIFKKTILTDVQNQAAGPQGRIPVRPQFGSQNQYMESPSGTPPFPILNNHNGNGGAINAPLMSPSTTTAVQTSMGNSNPVIGGNESGPASQETARFIMMSTGTGTRSVPQQVFFLFPSTFSKSRS
jgi:hypothetical protein